MAVVIDDDSLSGTGILTFNTSLSLPATPEPPEQSPPTEDHNSHISVFSLPKSSSRIDSSTPGGTSHGNQPLRRGALARN